ncbi:MAG: hypothetical protein CMN55_17370 [Sneathiella sp.]|uniref:hypothetical protein n=1 Tax=Sneathiella sp. TaxID=1964365 RepID=UPI000C5F248E|nr:hypothetical protein [Sneathiella sp.]MAL80842.1 hypothetical protein [Sneathiella sp.]
MSRSSTAAFWSKKDWPRQFLTGLLLLVFSAFAVLGMAHTSSSTHASQQNQAVASAQHDVSSHHSDNRGEAADERCCHPQAAPDLDCGQVCTMAAVLPEALSVVLTSDGEPSLRLQQSDLGRNPSGILRPPRLTSTA